MMLEGKTNTIHAQGLYEVDFNFNNKTVGKKVMDRAIMFMVAPEQYDSSGKVIEQALNKRLIYDTQRQRRLPTIVCSSDAVACYDRIVDAALSLALHRVGIPAGPVKSMIKANQELKNHIRTAFGDFILYFDCNTILLLLLLEFNSKMI